MYIVILVGILGFTSVRYEHRGMQKVTLSLGDEHLATIEELQTALEQERNRSKMILEQREKNTELVK